MAGEKPVTEKSKKIPARRRDDANAFISTKLRGYYESIIEEGTPDHILDLLERLDEAEKNFNNK